MDLSESPNNVQTEDNTSHTPKNKRTVVLSDSENSAGEDFQIKPVITTSSPQAVNSQQDSPSYLSPQFSVSGGSDNERYNSVANTTDTPPAPARKNKTINTTATKTKNTIKPLAKSFVASSDEEEEDFASDSDIASQSDAADLSNDSFIVDDESGSESEYHSDESVAKDDKGKYRTPAKAKPSQPAVTPSVTKANLNAKTPSKVASAFKKSVKKDSVVERLFREYNEKIFSSLLPASLSITWSNRLLTTAGITRNRTAMTVEGRSRVSAIELSLKVIDNHDRLVSTLLHELCHAAVWIVDGAQGGHGSEFFRWGNKVTKRYPHVPVSRCHAYEIHKKHHFRCSNEACASKWSAHTKKGVNIEKNVCGKCKSKILYVGIVSADGEVAKKREASGFSLYVKSHFASTKKKFRLTTQSEVMKQLAVLYKQDKEGGGKGTRRGSGSRSRSGSPRRSVSPVGKKADTAKDKNSGKSDVWDLTRDDEVDLSLDCLKL
eukprot:gene25011-31416_t